MTDSDKDQAFDFQTLQANLSSLLYIITEQHSLIGKLLGQLIDNKLLNPEQLRKITDVHGDKEELNAVYTELHKRRTKGLKMDQQTESKPKIELDGFAKEVQAATWALVLMLAEQALAFKALRDALTAKNVLTEEEQLEIEKMATNPDNVQAAYVYMETGFKEKFTKVIEAINNPEKVAEEVAKMQAVQEQLAQEAQKESIDG